MTTRERAADRGSRLARTDLSALGRDLRTARLMAGLTLRAVGRAVGMSYSQVGRIERGVLPSASVSQLARIGAVVGLDVRLRAYPGPAPLRDAGQLALIDRLRTRLHVGLRLRTEVPLAAANDQRAWDGVLSGFVDGGAPLRVEAETRIHDAQAQLRRITLKLRDDDAEHVLLVVADTPRNRAAVRAMGSVVVESFPAPARVTLAALAVGSYPGGSALVFL